MKLSTIAIISLGILSYVLAHSGHTAALAVTGTLLIAFPLVLINLAIRS